MRLKYGLVIVGILLFTFMLVRPVAGQVPGGVQETTTTMPTGTAIATVTPGCLFSDVCPGDYWLEPVRELVNRGAISGYDDNTFRPFNNATRGQLAKIVVIAAQFAAQIPPTPTGPTFRDVPESSPFFTVVETAAARGIISGYTCGEGCLEFRPNNDVTRGQLAKIITLAAGWPLVQSGVENFVDVPVSHPFYAYVETAANRGVISGYDDYTFRPQQNATRAQIAKIVYLAVTGAAATVTPRATATRTSTPLPTATVTSTSTQLPTQTATSTPEATATSTSTPLPTATVAPNACNNIVGYEATASVSNSTPAQNSDVTVFGTLCHNNAPEGGATMDTTWHYSSTTVGCQGITDLAGNASCTRGIGRASLGYEVVIDVVFTVGGQQVATAQTSFTPQ